MHTIEGYIVQPHNARNVRNKLRRGAWIWKQTNYFSRDFSKVEVNKKARREELAQQLEAFKQNGGKVENI